MRPQDQKVLDIARATGMATTENGRETFQDVIVGDLGMTCQFQTPDEHAHVQVYKNSKGYRTQDVYLEASLSLETIKADYPQFFID